MKKYLLGACLFLSTQAFAYTGATTDFTKLMLNQAVSVAVKESFEDVNATKQQCVGNALKPIMDRLAVTHIEGSINKSEQQLLDKFFDTPLGQEMFEELRVGDLRSFGRSIDSTKHNEADYKEFIPVITSYLQSNIVATLSADDELADMMRSSVSTCKLK
ncbi:hypothetical protein [Moraxella oblonga]|uniref:hypothetical protein n=1 Tax=Moraxella oblonga TaxID=200413 RepID=UPI00083166A4|nr:hypothetical protein [Moraxella oblonga]